MSAAANQISSRATLMRTLAIVSWIVALPLVSVAQSEPTIPIRTDNVVATNLPSRTVSDGGFRLPSNNVSLSLLSFAAGVGACLLVVSQLLPSIVRAHCADAIRDYMQFVHREADVRVVVVDRERPASDSPHELATTRRATVKTVAGGESRLRADRSQSQAVSMPSGVEVQSMLSQVYEQNVQLKDQVRSQAGSAKK